MPTTETSHTSANSHASAARRLDQLPRDDEAEQHVDQQLGAVDRGQRAVEIERGDGAVQCDDAGEYEERRMDPQPERLGHQQHRQRDGQQSVTQQDHAVAADTVETIAERAFEGVDQQIEGR